MQGPRDTLGHRGKGFQESHPARDSSFVHTRRLLLAKRRRRQGTGGSLNGAIPAKSGFGSPYERRRTFARVAGFARTGGAEKTNANKQRLQTEAPDALPTMFPRLESDRLWLSGQSNVIFQTHPPFPAAYSGENSLNPNYEKATSRVLTLYTGRRLNNSTGFLLDIEEAGGAALSTGLGLAGNTDLDIVRNPLLSKAPYMARGMIHKVFALSKDKIENQRSFLSLFDELPRRRLEIRFGKFSLPDFFDVNSVGSDTHLQFTNWSVDNNGAWDYTADTCGYTVGAVVDYEDRNWGFRFAEGLMPKVANGIDLVWRPWQVHAENWEYELRHGVLPRKSGVVRLLAYTNYANMGIYRGAVIQFEEGLVPAPTSHTMLGRSRESTASA